MNVFQISIAIVLTILLQVQTTYGQCVIKGHVVDVKKTPVAGVNVVIKGSSLGTVTDSKGHFQIATTSNDVTLMFMLIGKLPVEHSTRGTCPKDDLVIVMEKHRREKERTH